MKIRELLLGVLLLNVPTLSVAHGGGVDENGGHFYRKTGEYHCHKEPCYSNRQQVEKATQKAVEEQASFSTLYNRKDWPHWVDFDNDCQDTRAEVLIRTSTVPVKFKRNKGCNVTWGEWQDPYSGKTFTKASDLDIDHIIPLSWAHKHGGANWDRHQKRRFANDFSNLLAVDDSLNRQKSDKGPSEWMPPRKSYHCAYAGHWLRLLDTYNLQANESDLGQIYDTLSGCEQP